jgi:hypothetical protein
MFTNAYLSTKRRHYCGNSLQVFKQLLLLLLIHINCVSGKQELFHRDSFQAFCIKSMMEDMAAPLAGVAAVA